MHVQVVEELVQKYNTIPLQLRRIEELIEGTSSGKCAGQSCLASDAF